MLSETDLVSILIFIINSKLLTETKKSTPIYKRSRRREKHVYFYIFWSHSKWKIIFSARARQKWVFWMHIVEISKPFGSRRWGLYWIIVCICVCSVSQSYLTHCGPMNPLAHQAALSMEFSRQEDWSGLPFPTQRDLPNPGIYWQIFIEVLSLCQALGLQPCTKLIKIPALIELNFKVW